MRPEQRKRAAEIAVRVLAGRAQLTVFVGALDTDTAVELARHAERAGAGAISCVQPIYYRQVDEAIYRHYKALLDAVDIPVYAYDSPVYAGNSLSIPVLKRLAEAGLAGAISGAASLGTEHLWLLRREIVQPGFDIWSIRDGLALEAMMAGAAGFESGVANFYPELMVKLYDTIAAKDYEQAVILQGQALQLRDISHRLGKNIPTLHALIGMRGLETGVPRRPFFPLSVEEIGGLAGELAGLDFPLPFDL